MSIKKLKNVINSTLRQGVSPEKIAMSVTIGGVLGIFPIPGLATAMCAFFAVLLRLNHIVIQTVNYLSYPIQLLLLGGYIALGNKWFGGNSSIESFLSMAVLVRNDFWGGLLALKQFGLYAVAAWTVTSPLIAGTIYLLSKFAMGKITDKMKKNTVKTANQIKTKAMPNPHQIKTNQELNDLSCGDWQNSPGRNCKTCLA